MSKRTLDLKPNEGEMLKPKELMDLKRTGPLTLQDRRVFNGLVQHAWGPNLGRPSHWFEISTADLRDATIKSSRLSDSIERLMSTIVLVVEGEGEDAVEHRTALLSSNSLTMTSNSGILRYKFTEELAKLLKDSTIFAKLDLEVMKSFSSKYAFSLYEAIARRIRLQHVFTEEFDLDGMRDLLGVDTGKLQGYGNLNKIAIQPAVTEVNAIAPYEVTILPKKQGKKVVGFVMGWNMKDEGQMKAAYKEMLSHSSGRKARTKNQVIDTI